MCPERRQTSHLEDKQKMQESVTAQMQITHETSNIISRQGNRSTIKCRSGWLGGQWHSHWEKFGGFF